MSAVNTSGVRHHSAGASGTALSAQRWRWGLRDVGDQALIRGLDTAFPIIRPGLIRSYSGRRRCRHKASDGCSPAVAPLPPVRGSER